ncbi:MAG: hypothetical protein FK730_13680 [Asgard group archaeon]|nr:hypothetical protein [Asgard group archaeon]
MKILFVGSIAAIPQTLVVALRKRGIKTNMISKQRDNIFSIKEFVPDAKVISGRMRKFVMRMLLYARKYQIIHIHSIDIVVPYLRKLYPKKKIILTYHGTDIRSIWEERKKYWTKADVVSVATIDLMENAPEGIIYSPNPVDRELFERYNPTLKDSALFTYYDRFEINKDMPIGIAKEEAKNRKFTLIVIERDKWGRFKYPLFPRFLELFDYYIDARISHEGELIPSLSLTALQALSLGVKVVYYKQVLDEFPEEHDVNKVTDMWIEIYQKLLSK